MVNKIIEKVKNSNIIKCFIYVFLLILYWSLIDIFNQQLLKENFNLVNQEAFIFNSIWICIFIIILYILKQNTRRYIGLILNVLLLIFTIINYFMYSYFESVFSWKDLILSSEGISFINSIFKFINLKIIIFIIICIILNILIFVLCKFSLYKFKYKQTIIIIVIFITLIGLYKHNTNKLSNTTDGWDAKEILANKSNYYTNWIEPNKLIHICGTYQYIIKDFYMSFFYKQEISNAEDIIRNYINSKEDNKELKYNGIFKDKNLIFVMMEAIDDWLINEDVTPTISGMMEHGFNFNNHYSPAYVTGATANTEFVANTGIYPNIGHMSPNYAYTNNYYPFTLANLFKEEGYTVNSFHRSEAHIYNRKEMHLSFGYEKYHSFLDMGMDFKNIDYDRYLIINGYDKIVRDEKFMSFIITYSGHSPYAYTESKCIKNLEEIEKLDIVENLSEEEVCALSAARETDNMFKLLLEKLEEDDKLEDTVIIAFTDHPNNIVIREDEIDKLNKTVFFIYNSEMNNNQIETLTSSINVLPTTINLFGIDTDYIYPGYDALNTDIEHVIFKDYTYYDGKEIKPVTPKIEDDINYSKAILISDYYKIK